MADDIHVIETAPSGGKSLRCEFRRAGDRYSHVVKFCEGGGERIVLSSVEGGPDELWPASPPWQELHVHQSSEGRPILMLIGQAGKSHWSMSVSTGEDSLSVIFDIACRVRDVPEFLGCTYSQPREEEAPIAIRTGAEADSSAVLDASLEFGQLVLQPENISLPPTTVRWGLEVSAR